MQVFPLCLLYRCGERKTSQTPPSWEPARFHFTAQWPLSGMGETGPHKGSGHMAWLDTTLFWAERFRLQLSE